MYIAWVVKHNLFEIIVEVQNYSRNSHIQLSQAIISINVLKNLNLTK